MTRSFHKTSFAVGLVIASLSGVSVARADAISPAESACTSKQAGDACDVDSNTRGVCTASKCTRLDYSDGSPPSSVESDCLVCTAGSGADAGPDVGADAGADAGGDSEETKTVQGEDGNGCNASGTKAVAPWLLAAAPALIVSLLRRRKAKK